MRSEKNDFTQGSILKKLAAFMLPILGALVLQAAYGAVDLLVVGRFGSTIGLSAVSTGSQVLNLVTFVVTQLAMGVTVLIARYLGEKKPELIGSVIGGAAVVFTLLSAVLFVVMVGFARSISVLMQAPAEAVALTASYVRNLRFTPGAVAAGVAALRAGTPIVTDTNMALAGITRPGLAKVGSAALCYMADPEVAAAAKAAGTTRAVASMHRAAQEHPGAILAVGNAPTALLTIAEEIEAGLRPALVIGVPVGFVNVVESKEILFAACEAHGVPAIAAMGRKGGSNVAAAICNALVYSAAEMLDPTARGWK